MKKNKIFLKNVKATEINWKVYHVHGEKTV